MPEDERPADQEAETAAGPAERPSDAVGGEERTAAGGPLPSRVGRYRIRRVIGSGGMGTVYEAVQEHPRRTVALKVMKRGIASRSTLRRFEYESQILARLRHPGIAQVYEAGTHDDPGAPGEPVPYFAMEYIPNAKTIIEYATAKKLSTRDRLELFGKVCDAVHHGHQKGIIHRDLKPGNILVDSSGQPKIIDFGVARATDSDMAVTTLQTNIGQLIGTVQYMSPEQCEADPHDLDIRSDVYALGVGLYELVCGQLPYDVSRVAMHEAARVIREETPKRPSTINRALRGDVETIVLKALEKERERRYRSAADLGDDIRRYLNNEPIVAHPPSLAYQVRMFARRNKAISAAITSVVLVLVVAVVTISVFAFHMEKARSDAATAYAELETGIDSVRRYLWEDVSRYRSSANLLRRLSKDERPADNARTVACNIKPSDPGSLVVLDDDGTVVGRLDQNLAIPDWVRAELAGEHMFTVGGAIFEDVLPDHPGRELVVYMHEVGRHTSVLRVYDLDLEPLREMWNIGGFQSVTWDPQHRLLIVACTSISLPHYVPELAGYDSVGCPTGRSEAVVVFAIRPENIGGVLAPLRGDSSHPPAEVEWAFAWEPIEAESHERPWSVRIRSVEPPQTERRDAVGTLYLTLYLYLRRDATYDPRGPIWGRADLGADGRILDEAFRYDYERQQTDPPWPAHRFKRLDMALLSTARAKAEPLLRQTRSLEETERLLRDDPSLTPEALRSALDTARAMTTNWRWLHIEAEKIAMAEGAGPADYAQALDWAKAAVEIHNRRCPSPEACFPGWYVINTLASVQFHAGKYDDALATLNQCESVWAAMPGVNGGDALDAALIALAYHRLGRADQARSALNRAEKLLADDPPKHPDITDQADKALAEAQALITGR